MIFLGSIFQLTILALLVGIYAAFGLPAVVGFVLVAVIVFSLSGRYN